MKTYQTTQLARLIGLHPNTLRFYESLNLIPKPDRKPNGYRIYTDLHLKHLKLLRLAFKAEILSSNLRQQAVDIIKTAASGDYMTAMEKTRAYQSHLQTEINHAKEALRITEDILSNQPFSQDFLPLNRREAAAQIGITIDVLRDWERNGLIEIPRKGNRRQYGLPEMKRLKIISILRHSNYSQMSIRRMLKKLEHGETDLLAAIDTPEPTDDIISATDRYITSLTDALTHTKEMIDRLEVLKN